MTLILIYYPCDLDPERVICVSQTLHSFLPFSNMQGSLWSIVEHGFSNPKLKVYFSSGLDGFEMQSKEHCMVAEL